ncbi:DUF721 domain-containing protein [Candidatus Cyrtobacter comes]|uniref:DUF721 domain-containing protein n=1 Tax=Candidatus Cyrtobacter comes TaxID=675776 RepID=A0ABU5L7J4_9RICK|nr:DUF721 domain-containing protein [Candidatus Cyrtobacter comes]MDZ5762107.1 DUF721 domain-containing protein [Candidatus Cyrtobacter comes]
MFKHVAEYVDKFVSEHCLRNGSIFEKLVFHWEKIVGADIGKLCFPVKLVFSKLDAKLILGVRNSGFILKVKMSESMIKTNIASYLGRNLVSSINVVVVKLS